jgi:type IV secretory pathway TrbD component
MSFQAYLDNVEAKTGKSADDLMLLAINRGLADANGLAAGVKPGAMIDWLKADLGLGHGHAMAIVAFIKGKRS